jgi:hypothetical protein
MRKAIAMDKFGFLYVASGSKYMKESVASVTSLKQVMPEARVAIVTDERTIQEFPEESLKIFDNLLFLSETRTDIHSGYHGFLNKIRGIRMSPFQHTMFVDSDTYIACSVWEIFNSLHWYDLAVAIAPQKASTPFISTEKFLETHAKGNSFSTALNTGILCYKNTESVNRFLESWEETYIRKVPANNGYDRYYSDQTVFCEALGLSRLRPMILATEYNFRLGLPQSAQGLVKIFHGRPRQGWQRHVELVNSYEGYRIYFPNVALLCMKMKEGCYEIKPYGSHLEAKQVEYRNLQKLLFNDSEGNSDKPIQKKVSEQEPISKQSEQSHDLEHESHTANKVRILFWGLQRSGNHALIQWIMAHYPEPKLHLNNQVFGQELKANHAKYLKDYGISHKMDGFIHCDKTESDWLQKWSQPKDELNELLLISFENQNLTSLLPDFYQKGCQALDSSLLGKSQSTKNVIILRDPFNWIVSSYKTNRPINIDLWKIYAKEFLGITNFLPQKICINYNEWFLRKAYRQEIATQLDVDFTDAGLNLVSNVGGGSSFDQTTFDGQAQKMNVLGRWEQFEDVDFKENLIKAWQSDNEFIDITKLAYPELHSEYL